MIPHYGRVAVDSTVYVPFHTFSSDDPSASVTLTGLAVTDIEIYKNGSVTQRSSDAGYTLLDTDGIDFDGVTGLHGFSIDLSDNTDAGFFASGAFYMVAVSSITVDGATINFWACTFFIGGDGAALLTDTEAILTDAEAILADSEAILTDAEAILADTNELQGDWTNAGRLDAILDAVLVDTEASQTSESSILADTEASQTSESTIITDTEAVLVDTEASQTTEASILTDTEASQTSETSILADTEAAVTDTEAILTDTEAVLADTELMRGTVIEGTAQTGTLSTTQCTSDLTGYANDELIGRIINFTGGTADGQSSDITDYASASGLITFTAIPTAPANGDTFVIT